MLHLVQKNGREFEAFVIMIMTLFLFEDFTSSYINTGRYPLI